MAIEVRLPQLSEEMNEGTVTRWLKQVGDPVAKGEPLVEVETEKVIVEVEATEDGVLLEILAGEQEVVPVDGVLCVIGQPGERPAEMKAKPSPKKASGVPAEEAANGGSSNVVPLVQPPPVEAPASIRLETAVGEQAQPQLVVTPLARRVARELNIDLGKVTGSGIGGKVIMSDLQPFMGSGTAGRPAPPLPDARPAAAAPARPMGAGGAEFEDVAHSALRGIVARRMAESKAAIPHFYMTAEIDVTECLALRGRLNAKMADGRITVNDMMLKAAAVALGEVPGVNAEYMDGAVRRYRGAHIAFATAIEEGLVTPVLRDCQIKSIGVIARETAGLIEQAKSRTLKPEQMQGGTFTISNLGMRDVVEFSAIINPPQVAILAVARPVERPVVKNGWVVIRSLLNATLSADHRALDGVTGADFLEALKAVLEDPERMLL